MGLKYYSNGLKEISTDFEAPIYANTASEKYPSYTSIRDYHGMIYPLQKNIYANISKLSTEISNDTSYGTLINTTSMTFPSKTNVLNEKIYENVHTRVVESSPIYINLNNLEEKSIVFRKIDQEEEIVLSSIHSKIDIETNILVERSMIQTKQTIEKVEVSKNDSHRTRIPRIPSSLRRRRTLNRPRRYRRRSSTPFRATTNSNTSRRQQLRSNPSNDHAMNSNHRRKRSTHKSATNQLYREVDSSILHDAEETFEDPLEFDHPEEEEELIQQVVPTSENRESVQEDDFCPHDTFADFLLRRRPHSSCSTLASVTNTIISSETLSQEVPPRPPPLNPRLPGIALSLDKKDVDFIHDIIQRTHGDRRVSNRITALKEAYVRAASKRIDLLKAKETSQLNENLKKKKMTMKHSVIASKIRDELEKYDELPVHRKPIFHDEDEDDETYSTNDEYRYHHCRRLPPEPSTTHRIMTFLTSVKRQLQKNFHEIRSRILIEAMSNPRHKHSFHYTTGPSRRPKTSHGILPRSISHNSIEHCYSPRRQQPHFSRSHSNISQCYLPSFEKYYSNRPRTFQVTPHSQRP